MKSLKVRHGFNLGGVFALMVGSIETCWAEEAIEQTPPLQQAEAPEHLQEKDRPSPKVAGNRVAFLVNNEAVFTKILLDRLRFAAISLGMPPSPEVLEKLRLAVIQGMVNEILQRQMAEKMGITLEKGAVEEAFQNIAKGNNMTSAELKAFLEKNNIPVDTLKNQIRANLLWMEYIRKKYEHSLAITPQEVEAFETRFQAKQQKTHYNLAEIVLYVHQIKDEKSVKQQAEQIVEWLRNGAPFQKVAHQFSQSATKNQGGHIGWISEEDLEDEVRKALQQMTPGMLSVPLRTASGYVILAFIEKKDPESTATAPDKNQVINLLRSEHLERLARRELAALQKKIPVEIRQ